MNWKYFFINADNIENVLVSGVGLTDALDDATIAAETKSSIDITKFGNEVYITIEVLVFLMLIEGQHMNSNQIIPKKSVSTVFR